MGHAVRKRVVLVEQALVVVVDAWQSEAREVVLLDGALNCVQGVAMAAEKEPAELAGEEGSRHAEKESGAS